MRLEIRKVKKEYGTGYQIFSKVYDEMGVVFMERFVIHFPTKEEAELYVLANTIKEEEAN